MGMFKSIKDMKNMVHAAPGIFDQANQMAANAQAMQQAHLRSQAQQAPAAPMPESGDIFEPIAGVDLAMYAQISAGLAQFGYDVTKAVGLAAAQGIDATSWQAALDGWNQRIAAHPAVASRFNALYTG